MSSPNTLFFVYQDQLTHSLFENLPHLNQTTFVFVEAHNELTYVKHHKKKLVFWLSCMRVFASELKAKGCHVLYYSLEHTYTKKTVTYALRRITQEKAFKEIVLYHPSEYRQLKEVQSLNDELNLPVHLLEDPRFICSQEEFKKWGAHKKNWIMEFFYREMRKKTGYLMDGNQPIGMQWNLDKENRKPLKGSEVFSGPKKYKTTSSTQKVIEEVEKHFNDHFGTTKDYWFATSAKEAQHALDHFILTSLVHFGDFQDSMKLHEPYLYHSLLSQYLNIGLLTARQVCDAICIAFEKHHLPLNSVEGYLRQIIGWREFVRGVYWQTMPEYAQRNHLNAKRKLPKFYWDAQTKMTCLKHTIKQTQEQASSHHIQRLMITGNFALIAGIIPQEVCDWYLIVYADAYDWVELPNTLGMALFADGGLLGTKPYAASGNYINKMSNFCSSCYYDVKQKTGEKACPFNYLYWNFLMENENELKSNRRLTFAYKALENKEEKEVKAIKESSQAFFNSFSEKS